MSIVGYLTAILSMVFFFSAITHALFNDFYESTGIGGKRTKLLHAHYTILYLFTILTAIYCRPVLNIILPALLLFLPFWFVIHALRLGLDFADGVGSRNVQSVLRQANDALANLVTFAFVLSVATIGNPILIWVAMFLSIGMVGKELFYRILSDLLKRSKSKRKTTHGGPGRETPWEFKNLHNFVNSIKSMGYMILGFALIYKCLSSIWPSYISIIFEKSEDVHDFNKALAFTVKNFQLSFGGGSDRLLNTITAFEALCGIVIAISLSSVQFRR